jgi:hypothetical protein
MRRMGRKGFMQYFVYPFFGYFPWQCLDCEETVLLKIRYKRKKKHSKSAEGETEQSPAALGPVETIFETESVAMPEPTETEAVPVRSEPEVLPEPTRMRARKGPGKKRISSKHNSDAAVQQIPLPIEPAMAVGDLPSDGKLDLSDPEVPQERKKLRAKKTKLAGRSANRLIK